MEILVTEDEASIADLYRVTLDDRGHNVTVMSDGDEAIRYYKARLKVYVNDKKERMRKGSFPFDVVVLDYRMPKKDGLTVATEILELNPHQRIIFASAYVRETLVESIKSLKHVVELLQKPFEMDALIDTIEDKAIYEELSKVNINIKTLEELNLSHSQLSELLRGVQTIGKNSALAKAASGS